MDKRDGDNDKGVVDSEPKWLQDCGCKAPSCMPSHLEIVWTGENTKESPLSFEIKGGPVCRECGKPYREVD